MWKLFINFNYKLKLIWFDSIFRLARDYEIVRYDEANDLSLNT